MEFQSWDWFRKCEIVHISTLIISIIHPAFEKLVAIDHNIRRPHAMRFTIFSYKSQFLYRFTLCNSITCINTNRWMFEYLQTGHLTGADDRSMATDDSVIGTAFYSFRNPKGIVFVLP